MRVAPATTGPRTRLPPSVPALTANEGRAVIAYVFGTQQPARKRVWQCSVSLRTPLYLRTKEPARREYHTCTPHYTIYSVLSACTRGAGYQIAACAPYITHTSRTRTTARYTLDLARRTSAQALQRFSSKESSLLVVASSTIENLKKMLRNIRS